MALVFTCEFQEKTIRKKYQTYIRGISSDIRKQKSKICKPEIRGWVTFSIA